MVFSSLASRGAAGTAVVDGGGAVAGSMAVAVAAGFSPCPTLQLSSVGSLHPRCPFCTTATATPATQQDRGHTFAQQQQQQLQQQHQQKTNSSNKSSNKCNNSNGSPSAPTEPTASTAPTTPRAPTAPTTTAPTAPTAPTATAAAIAAATATITRQTASPPSERLPHETLSPFNGYGRPMLLLLLLLLLLILISVLLLLLRLLLLLLLKLLRTVVRADTVAVAVVSDAVRCRRDCHKHSTTTTSELQLPSTCEHEPPKRNAQNLVRDRDIAFAHMHTPTETDTHTHTHTHTTIHTHSRTQTQVAKRFQSYCLSFYVYERHVRLQICALQEQIPWRRFAFQKEIFCNCMRLTVNFFCPLHTSKTSSLVSLHFRAFSTTCQHVQMQVSKTPPCTSLTKLCVLEAWLLQFNRCGYKFPACPHVSVRNPCASLCVTKGATA